MLNFLQVTGPKFEDLSINLTALDMDALYESIIRHIAEEVIVVQGG